jgi:CheY-like chemotaxis protein
MTELPARDAPTALAEALETRTSAHVLLADGDNDSRERRGAQLRAAGCRVSEARTGFEAIVKASCHVPDVIVISRSLPDIDASETERLISTCPMTAHIPVVQASNERTFPQRVLALSRRDAR